MPFSITQDSTGCIGTRLWDGRLRIRTLFLGERKMFICSPTYPNKIPGPNQPPLQREPGTPFRGEKLPWYESENSPHLLLRLRMGEVILPFPHTLSLC